MMVAFFRIYPGSLQVVLLCSEKSAGKGSIKVEHLGPVHPHAHVWNSVVMVAFFRIYPGSLQVVLLCSEKSAGKGSIKVEHLGPVLLLP